MVQRSEPRSPDRRADKSYSSLIAFSSRRRRHRNAGDAHRAREAGVPLRLAAAKTSLRRGQCVFSALQDGVATFDQLGLNPLSAEP